MAFGRGEASPATVRRVPLSFWFCDDPSMALPLVALRKTVDVRVDVTLSDNAPIASVITQVHCEREGV